jgi:muramoyltetrapeptide carboxypeptidase LdcA involved in peptidoglycan recycling
MAANRWMRPVEDYPCCILLLETSEEQPPAQEVYRLLRNMGERGLLQQFSARLSAWPRQAHAAITAQYDASVGTV